MLIWAFVEYYVIKCVIALKAAENKTKSNYKSFIYGHDYNNNNNNKAKTYIECI